jgi:hypothetical protein
MRQLAPSATAGRRHKGSLDLAKLEPAIRGTPVVESYHARVLRRSSRTAFENHT